MAAQLGQASLWGVKSWPESCVLWWQQGGSVHSFFSGYISLLSQSTPGPGIPPAAAFGPGEILVVVSGHSSMGISPEATGAAGLCE